MLRNLIEYIAMSVVEHPEAVIVEEHRRGDRVVITLQVDESDMGRVIGKEGRIANAMRTILKVAGSHRDEHTALEVR